MAAKRPKLRDRVIDFRRVKARDLVPHPHNWRLHPKAQTAALKGILDEVGVAGALLAYEREGHPSDHVPRAGGAGVGDTGWATSQGGNGPMFGAMKRRKNGTSSLMSDQQGQNVAPGDFIGPGLAYPGNRLPPFQSDHQATGHAAAFPVGLPAFFINAFTDEGDHVYDPFLGSGSVIMAAERTKRRGYGMEISPKYVAVSLQRWADATGKTPVLDG